MFTVLGTEPRLTVEAGRHTLTAGARYVTEDVDFDVNRVELANDNRSEVRKWDQDTNALALYASDTMAFMDGRLTLTPGLRYENVRMDFDDALSGDSRENNTDELLPGLTTGFQASDGLFLFANSQRSLVPVQIAQVTREGDVANETAWNYEVGARLRPMQGLVNSLTLFRIDYEDQIQFNRTTSRFENLGETRHQGVELDNRWQFTDNLELGLGYSFLDTEQRSGANKGNDLPNAPEHQVSADAVYNVQQWQASLNWEYVATSFSDAANTEAETANASAGKLPDYHLVKARLGRDIPLGAQRQLNLSLAVNNLLDEDYYFRGVDVSPVGRVPQPGRSVILEAQLDF